MRHEALLMTQGGLAVVERNIGKVLEFFGVPWRTTTLTGFPVHDGTNETQMFCSAETFLSLLADFDNAQDAGPPGWSGLGSVFVYGGDDVEALQTLARKIISHPVTVTREKNGAAGDFVVADDSALCGAMAGVRIAASSRDPAPTFRSLPSDHRVVTLVSDNHGAIFVKLRYRNVDIFLATPNQIIDMEVELGTGIFDIREQASAALPIVLYIRRAFAEHSWQPVEVNACLIIDDPLLRPKYGYVDFYKLRELMRRHRFSTNIAFIPWNFRRSSREVARLFQPSSSDYSLSVHGCDHTRAEFGSCDESLLQYKLAEASERMAEHERETGICHDRVMVFPQGVFSEAAMRALKRTDMLAAVNNDTISADPRPRAITISDVWDVAVMCYNQFPLFTRRNPWEGVENFAFDILLGKPAIAVIHHDYCSDACKRLVDFVDRLNALRCRVHWRSLGEVVRRSCRSREISPGVIEVQMYGNELRLENRSPEPKRFVVSKRESDPSSVESFSTRLRQLSWSIAGGAVKCDVELVAGEATVVRIAHQSASAEERKAETFSYKVGIMMRRYLCELRDNYIAKYRLGFSSLLRSH